VITGASIAALPLQFSTAAPALAVHLIWFVLRDPAVFTSDDSTAVVVLLIVLFLIMIGFDALAGYTFLAVLQRQGNV
jgi:hypothetical protein